MKSKKYNWNRRSLRAGLLCLIHQSLEPCPHITGAQMSVVWMNETGSHRFGEQKLDSVCGNMWANSSGANQLWAFHGLRASSACFTEGLGGLGQSSKLVKKWSGFPGGAVVEGLPANAGDTGSSPGLGGSHMPWSSWAHEPQLLSLRLWSLCPATRGRDSERPTHRDEEWPRLAATRESPCTETKTQHSQK